MNPIKNLMKTDEFTSSQFNAKLKNMLHDRKKPAWSSRATLHFLYVAESLGMVKCLGAPSGQYIWRCKNA